MHPLRLALRAMIQSNTLLKATTVLYIEVSLPAYTTKFADK
jgi:hypothetical protein